MSGFTVVPELLAAPAQRCDGVAEVLAAVARAVVSVTASTGRADDDVLLVHVLQRLGTGVQELVEPARRDAEALRCAGHGYAVAELRASGR